MRKSSLAPSRTRPMLIQMIGAPRARNTGDGSGGSPPAQARSRSHAAGPSARCDGDARRGNALVEPMGVHRPEKRRVRGSSRDLYLAHGHRGEPGGSPGPSYGDGSRGRRRRRWMLVGVLGVVAASAAIGSVALAFAQARFAADAMPGGAARRCSWKAIWKVPASTYTRRPEVPLGHASAKKRTFTRPSVLVVGGLGHPVDRLDLGPLGLPLGFPPLRAEADRAYVQTGFSNLGAVFADQS
jgi:hypothetical protein